MANILNESILTELKEIMCDDFPGLLSVFLRESKRQCLEVKQALAEGDMELLRRAAHSLKGSSANVGAEELQQTCAELELGAQQGLSSDLETLVEVASGQLKIVSERIEEMA